MSLITLETISPQELKVLTWLRNNQLVDSISKFCDRPDCYTKFLSGIVGWQWEDEFRSECEIRGFICQKPKYGSFDIIVNDKRVQCKFTSNKNRADIRSKKRTYGSNNKYDAIDFDILALKMNNDVYIIPTSSILYEKDLTKIKTNVRIEDIQQFKDKYDVF